MPVIFTSIGLTANVERQNPLSNPVPLSAEYLTGKFSSLGRVEAVDPYMDSAEVWVQASGPNTLLLERFAEIAEITQNVVDETNVPSAEIVFNDSNEGQVVISFYQRED